MTFDWLRIILPWRHINFGVKCLLKSSICESICFWNKAISSSLSIKANNRICSAYYRISGIWNYWVASRTRVSAEEFLKILLRIKSLHSSAKWLALGESLVTKSCTLFTFKCSRFWHFWIKTCIFIEFFPVTVIRTIENSISWLRSRNCPLFIDNNSNSSTRNRWYISTWVPEMG